MKVQAQPDGDLYLIGPSGGGAQFQHYAFTQFSNMLHVPANFMRELPADIAATVLNSRLPLVKGKSNLLFHMNGGRHLRSISSDRYERIWNFEVADIALALQGEGWKVPPARPCGIPGIPQRPATREDVLQRAAHKSLGIREGDMISPAGLYASDHDCFIFQVNEDYGIEAGNGEVLYRGVFWSNSEISGAAKFRATMFLFDSVCGNHIVWGAKHVTEIALTHVGNVRRTYMEAMATITANAMREASDDEKRIQAAKQFELGPTKDKVIDLVFRKGILTKGEATDAWVLADRHADDHNTNPATAWGYAAGVTRLSQQSFADARDKMDRAAGKILEMAF
jgi:hypothetical protein